MTLLEFFKNLSMGGWMSVFIILATLIEITPIKINPIGWLGRKLNADMYKRVDKIESKLDVHVAQSYRTKILNFQDKILVKGANSFTKEQYDEVLDAVQEYEKYCSENKVQNHKCNLAIGYIKRCYEQCQNQQNFANLPN